jgi:hypothetical protein
MQCFGFGVPEPSPTIVRKEERRLRTAGVTRQRAAAKREWRGGADTEGVRGSSLSESKTCRENGSTSRRFAARKSTPKIGLE